MKRFLLCAGLAMILLLATGCGGKNGGGKVDVVKLIREAVTAYFLGDYEGAREKVEELMAKEPNRTEAYAVLGLIYMAQDSLTEAAAQFASALEEGREGNIDHAYVGRAMLNRELDYGAAIQDGETVLTTTPDYKLPSDEMEVDPPPPFVLTADDIKLLVAQCYYLLGQFQEAQAAADIQNLDPNSSATWVVGGIAYKSYEAALGAALQALDESIVRGAA